MANKIALLNEELEQLLAQRAQLKADGGGQVKQEDRAKDGDLVDRMAKTRELLEGEQAKERDRIASETAQWMENPRHQVQHPVNTDQDGRKELERAGWEFKGDKVYRNTSQGLIEYCATDVFFGRIPDDDQVAAAHYRQTRASLQPEYRNAFDKYIRNRGDKTALTGPEQNALSEGTAGDGGYLVPADRAAEILARREQTSVMRRLSTVRQTSRNVYEIPAVTPHATSGSIYSSGFVGGLVGEVPVATDQGPTFQMYSIGIKKFQSYTKVTNDLIADSASDVMGFLAADGGRNLGLVEDNYFLNGDGTGLQPLGLLNGGSTTVDVEGTTSNTLDNSTSDQGAAPKIINLAYSLPAQYAAGASWLMLRAVKGLIHALVDADGRPWWQPAAGAGGAGDAPMMLVGAPVFEHAFMPDDGTNGNKVLVFGDFSSYIIADRTSLSVWVDDITLRGSSDETAIYLRSRAGGGVWNVDAFRFGIV